MLRRTCALTLLAACGDGGGFPDARGPDSPGPTGTFSLAWSVIDQNSQPISCDRVAASTMAVLAHNLAFDGGVPEVFTCSTGMGMSQGLVPGTYEMDFEIAGPLGFVARAPRRTGLEIAANANLELEPVTFQVEALGGLELSLSSGKPGGNCGAIASNGAGIQQVTITLTHNSDGSCEPITLNISQGATQAGGTYTINCATPMTRACIETDQLITAGDVPSDSYTIRVRGKIGGNDCWANSDTIQVPPLDQVLTRTLNLAQQTQIPGCE